jgi:hypothetical protein
MSGSTIKEKKEKHGIYRAAADYIAGMTDRYAIIEYERHNPENTGANMLTKEKIFHNYGVFQNGIDKL